MLATCYGIMRRTKDIAIMLVILQMAFPPSLFAASGKVTAAVVAVQDGNGDGESRDASDRIRQFLKKDPALHVVEKEKAANVLRYHARDDSSETARLNGLLAKAKENYYRLNYHEAKTLAGSVVSSINSSPDAIYGQGAALLDAYLTLGIINKSMGNTVEARQAFEEALRLDPGYTLDSRAFSPAVVSLFEEVKGSQGSRPKGAVNVSSSPKVAEVYIDGIMKGVTPLLVEGVSEGEHYLEVKANKFGSVKKKITVSADKKLRVRENLSWKGGAGEGESGSDAVSGGDATGRIEDALKVANLMRVDKVVLVDVATGAKSAISARIIDAKFRTSHRPITVPYDPAKKSGDGVLAALAKDVSSEARTNLAANPQKNTDPAGYGSPALMGKKKSKISKKVLWGVLAGVLAAGLGGGLAAAFAGGGSDSSGGGTGSISVTFR